MYAERCAELLDEPPGVAEDQSLLALVKRRDHLGRVLDRPDVVELDVAGRRFGNGGGEGRMAGRLISQLDTGRHDVRGAVGERALKPAKQLVRVADRGGKPHSLQRTPGQPGQAFEDRQEVPSPVVPGECVHFVDDDGAQ